MTANHKRLCRQCKNDKGLGEFITSDKVCRQIGSNVKFRNSGTDFSTAIECIPWMRLTCLYLWVHCMTCHFTHVYYMRHHWGPFIDAVGLLPCNILARAVSNVAINIYCLYSFSDIIWCIRYVTTRLLQAGSPCKYNGLRIFSEFPMKYALPIFVSFEIRMSGFRLDSMQAVSQSIVESVVSRRTKPRTTWPKEEMGTFWKDDVLEPC